MRVSNKLTLLSAASLASVALMALPATSAHATSGCWAAGFTVWNGEVPHKAFYCNNAAPTPVYSDLSYAHPVGTLNTRRSWFICKADGGAPNGSSAHPTRWLLTQADTPGDRRGWVPDKHIVSETNPLENCP